MVKAISLQDYYNRLEAFYDPDPMIRIAAIHRAGNKLERNAQLRETLQNLLNDKDPLVARYAAITLAQSGDTRGLAYLIQAISRVQGQDRQELDGCLRNCVRFPFAVLLNERLFIETIPTVRDKDRREVLDEALRLTSDSFYEKSEGDSSFRDSFLKILSSLDRLDGLRVRAGSISDVGWVVSPPMGKQPGFLCCPSRRLFLKFQEESVLNRGYMERGRQVLFVAKEEEGGDADCLYVLEDAAPRQEALTPEVMTGFARQSGLLPGVILTKWDAPESVDVVCANGKAFSERYRAQKAFVGQFVLVEEETALGKPQCHFIPRFRLDPTVIREIVSDYAAFNNFVLARLTSILDSTYSKRGESRCVVRTDKGEEVTMYVPAPREQSNILTMICPKCEAAGEIHCDACAGRGENPCYGNYVCWGCKGRGTLQDGDKCLLCSQTGFLKGCEGKGRVDCPVCGGQGKTRCNKCTGSGQSRCGRCSATGKFTCPVCQGNGRAPCKVCNGSGRNLHGDPHAFCNGTGKVKCGYCSGVGQKDCGTCHGSCSIVCDLCDGNGAKECSYCHSDAQIRCLVCRGAGNLSCDLCKTKGRIRCPRCQGSRLVFQSRVDCLRS